MATPKKRITESPPPGRLSPEDFRSSALLRGWTYRALAERWQCSENWISKIARNPDRSPHYDDAVRGLPQRTVDPDN
ncbi:MAG: XRE family transcriptional regulator [Rhodanobacter sp.]|jgi:hypothetical protein